MSVHSESKYATVAANVAPGDAEWDTLDKIAFGDAGQVTSSYIAEYGPTTTLLVNGFGFNIPTNATITGISATVKWVWGGAGPNTVTYNLTKFTKAGTAVGNDLFIDNGPPFTIEVSNIDFTESTRGTSSTLFGATWDPSDINSDGIGLAIKLNISGGAVSVDWINLTVYYTTPDTAPTATPQPTTYNHVLGVVINVNDHQLRNPRNNYGL